MCVCARASASLSTPFFLSLPLSLPPSLPSFLPPSLSVCVRHTPHSDSLSHTHSLSDVSSMHNLQGSVPGYRGESPALSLSRSLTFSLTYTHTHTHTHTHTLNGYRGESPALSLVFSLFLTRSRGIEENLPISLSFSLSLPPSLSPLRTHTCALQGYRGESPAPRPIHTQVRSSTAAPASER